MNSAFEFQYPWLLGLLVLLPIYAVLLGRNGHLSALRFPSVELIRTVSRPARSGPGRLRIFLRLLASALVIITLAGPRAAHEQTENQSSGVDIMLLLDVSWSMMALDMGQPAEHVTRFDVARSVLRDFIERRQGDRIGLIIFSALPYSVSPLTLDHEWLVQNLERIHIGSIQDLGTGIGDATAAAVKRMAGIKNSKSRIIILLTDGDNNTGEINPVPAADLAAALGVKIYTIGIGQEAACPLPAFEPTTGKLRLGPQGEILPTITLRPANYQVLDQMARITRGRKYRATNRAELTGIYNEIDRLEKTEVKLRRYTRHTTLFQWPLLTAMATLSLELFLAATWLRRVP
ncbi:MAG: VWA domain-containing protein [Verrucomicrobiota bacterium]